jgi:hypothetical protein
LVATIVAFETRNMVVQRDAVAHDKPLHLRASLDNGAGRLVPEHTRGRNCAVLDLLDISGANPTNRNANQHLVLSNSRDGYRLQSKLRGPTVDNRVHGLWDGVCHGRNSIGEKSPLGKCGLMHI